MPDEYKPPKAMPAKRPPPGLAAVAKSRTARRRAQRWVTVATVGTVVCVAAVIALIGLRPSPRAEPAAVASPPLPSLPPVIVVHAGVVTVDGQEVGRTDGIAESGRIRRIDGLFDALKGRRMTSDNKERTAILDADADTPAVVVKSVFQTAAFAGFDDVRFVMRGGSAEDGG